MSKAEVRAAKSVCYLCPVRRECLEYALAAGERWGVWGGLTTPERDRAVMFLKTEERIMKAYDAGKLEAKVVRR